MSPEVTTVLLVFNERDNIEPLVKDILAVYDRKGIDGEVLLGDDGSTDGSFDVCEAMASSDPRVRVFHHKADPEHGHPIDNWNRAWTILHGFQGARGETVIIMDGDRQYDPGQIPEFLEKMEEGWDVVSGHRTHRADTWYRRLQSRTYNRIFISGIFGMDVRDQNSGFKAFRRSFALRIPFDPRGYRGIHRFILPLCYVIGGRITEIPVEHFERKAGRSYIKTSTVPFIFLSDLFLRFYPRHRKELSAMRRIRRRLGRMPVPGDEGSIAKMLPAKVYEQPVR